MDFQIPWTFQNFSYFRWTETLSYNRYFTCNEPLEISIDNKTAESLREYIISSDKICDGSCDCLGCEDEMPSLRVDAWYSPILSFGFYIPSLNTPENDFYEFDYPFIGVFDGTNKDEGWYFCDGNIQGRCMRESIRCDGSYDCNGDLFADEVTPLSSLCNLRGAEEALGDATGVRLFFHACACALLRMRSIAGYFGN